MYIGQLGTDGEVDFVAMKADEILYFQISETTLDENVLTRELAPLKRIRDHYPKYLLTLDNVFAEADYDGIRKQNVLKWMNGDYM